MIKADVAKDETVYEIFQVPLGEEYRGIRYASFKEAEEMGGVNPKNYQFVAYGSVKTSSSTEELESVFQLYNDRQTGSQRMRSLSMSDVVVLHENGAKNAYYIDTTGFRNLPDFTINKPISLLDSGLKIDEMPGTWRVIDREEMEGHSYFLLENEQFAGDAANIMVDSAGQVMLTGVEVGFVSQEVKTELAAATAIKMSETKTASQIIRENPLANAEVDEEGNYNMIDGVPNNGWGDKKKPKEEIVADDTEMKKESVLGKLEHYKELVGSGDNNEERSL